MTRTLRELNEARHHGDDRSEETDREKLRHHFLHRRGPHDVPSTLKVRARSVSATLVGGSSTAIDAREAKRPDTAATGNGYSAEWTRRGPDSRYEGSRTIGSWSATARWWRAFERENKRSRELVI